MSRSIASKLIRKNPCLSLLQQCKTMAELKQIHAQIFRTCLFEDSSLLVKLIEVCLLLKLPTLSYARRVFDQMDRPTTSICNTLIKAYNKASSPDNAVALFRGMLVKGARPNYISFAAVSEACALVVLVENVHGQVYKCGFGCDVYVMHSLVCAYARCGCCAFARKMFDELPERDLISWTVVIYSYIRNDDPGEAVGLFFQMRDEQIEPDEVATVAVFNACAELGDLELGCKLEALLSSCGCAYNSYVSNSLIDMYAKCGSIMNAQQVFDRLVDKNVVSWNTIIAAYARLGNMEVAKKLFEQSPERNAISWSIMINGYVINGSYREALKVFHEMNVQGLRPNVSSITSALMACGHVGSLSLGQEIHQNLDSWGIQVDVVLSTALVDMYARCGCIEISLTMFDTIAKKNLVSYNVMIMGLANHGKASDCIDLFTEMVKAGIEPNSITFVGILSGCAHAGWLEKGIEYFNKMQAVYKIAPRTEHFTCMVHLMGRAGLMVEAYKFIQTIPVNPDVSVWGALLNACKIHGHVELSEIAAKRILDLEPNHGGAYALLSSVYATSNQWKEMKEIRNWIKRKGVDNRPGWSRIEINGRVHEFLAGEMLHPDIREIYFTLDVLQQQDLQIELKITL